MLYFIPFYKDIPARYLKLLRFSWSGREYSKIFWELFPLDLGDSNLKKN